MESRKILTLCLIEKDVRVLLGMKKRGFGAGLWNGFGGKVGEGETIEAAARREVLEETGLQVSDLTKKGIIDFDFPDGKRLQAHVFQCESFAGQPIETEEMRPQWFAKDQIPFERMWSTDRHWLPLFLAGKQFTAWFQFDHKDQVVDYRLQEI